MQLINYVSKIIIYLHLFYLYQGGYILTHVRLLVGFFVSKMTQTTEQHGKQTLFHYRQHILLLYFFYSRKVFQPFSH